MVRTLLIRGMIMGVLAGLLAFGFGRVFCEPPVDRAIAFEDQMHQSMGTAPEMHPSMGMTPEMHQSMGMAPEVELVSRAVQSTIGLFTAVVVYGSALGGIFALVFAYAQGRLGRLSPRGTAVVLAAAAFVVLVLVPQIKYPANPPAIGDPMTIGWRTALYFTMIAVSVISAIAAASTGKQLLRRLGVWNSAVVAGAAYLVVITVVMLILPPVNEIPTGFPAGTLWNFRLASLGIEAVLWTTLGLGFGYLAERQFAVERHSPGRIVESIR